ncbi:hypothetical protein [Yeosuana marina]|uniref:hypothetical protein n=1 Tax=Yeosuana marina TaxID=1565536 RepID=UPI0030EE708C|tara:strand:+ start:950 stop:1540 length:591 start_codon:yes stop_codon:yes gene_type:complete
MTLKIHDFHTFVVMYDKELTIREPKVPWFNRILFSVIFSAFLTFIIYFFSDNVINELTTLDLANATFYLIWLFGVLIVFILPLISRHYIHFNFSNFKIMHSYSIGIFTYNEKWQNLEDLKYISVFNAYSGYEINLWYKKNKFLRVFALEDSNEAFEKAFSLSEKLNIDLLDARIRGNHRWVYKSAYRETGKIEYID